MWDKSGASDEIDARRNGGERTITEKIESNYSALKNAERVAEITSRKLSNAKGKNTRTKCHPINKNKDA